MTEQTDTKVPKIRFKGFEGQWEAKPIGDVLSEKKRPIVLRDQQRYELITVKRRNEGIVSRGHLLGRDILVKNYSQLAAGDFVISKRQVVHGATGIIPEKLEGAIVSNEYLVAVENSRISTVFFTILASLPDMRQKFFLSSYGVDIEKLFFDAEDWKKRSVTIPRHTEQVRIGEYFRKLDSLIGLHQRKHGKLVTLKKAMLLKMFPEAGTSAPDIRFKGFSQPWLESTLGIEAVVTMGQSPPGSTYTDDPRDYILVQGNADMKNGFVNPRVWTTRVIRTASAGDIILSVRAPVGEAGKTNYDVVLGRSVAGVKGNEFIFQTLLRLKYLRYWERFSSGSTFDAVNSTDVQQAVIRVPCLSEQEKIGTYLRNLDLLISKHAIQLKKLKQIKSACLEKMFV